MQRVAQVVAICFLGVSAFVIWESWDLEYYTNLGPGPGFFPFWLGIIMGVLSFVWLIQEIKGMDNRKSSFLAKDANLTRVILPILALLAVAYSMNILGFQLSMFLFLIFLLKILGRQNLLVSLLVALLGSFGVYHIFTRYLDIILPIAIFKSLANLGL